MYSQKGVWKNNIVNFKENKCLVIIMGRRTKCMKETISCVGISKKVNGIHPSPFSSLFLSPLFLHLIGKSWLWSEIVFFLFYSIARKMRATKENEKKSLMLNSGWGMLREIWVKGKWKDFDNVIDYCRRKIFSQKSSLNSLDPIRTWLTKPPKKINPETSWKYLKTIFIDWLWEGQ